MPEQIDVTAESIVKAAMESTTTQIQEIEGKVPTAPVAEPVVEPEVKTETTPEPKPVDDIEVIRARMEALAKSMVEGVQQTQAQQPQTQVQQTQQTQIEEVTFIDPKTDLTELTAEQLNKTLNAVFQRGLAEGKKGVVTEDKLQQFEQKAKQNTESMVMFRDFFTQNNDFKPYTNFVALESQTIMQQNPTFTWDQLFEKLETNVRTKLHLQKEDGKGKKQEKAALPKQTGARSAQEQQSTLQSQLDELSPKRIRTL